VKIIFVAVLCFASIVAVQGCSWAKDHEPRPASAGASEFSRVLVPIPEYGPGFTSSGEYIQISGPGNLQRVNDALRNVVLDDMGRVRSAAPLEPLGKDEFPGEYGIYGAQADAAVNASIVSVLIPASLGYPGGGSVGGYWLSATLRVPSAESVDIADLFNDPASAFTHLGQLILSEMRADPCLSSDMDLLPPSVEWDTAEPYRNYALSADGLILGFDKYSLGAGACGKKRIVINWQRIESLLSAEGLTFEREMRRARPSQSSAR
jgi:hypothetical protein